MGAMTSDLYVQNKSEEAKLPATAASAAVVVQPANPGQAENRLVEVEPQLASTSGVVSGLDEPSDSPSNALTSVTNPVVADTQQYNQALASSSIRGATLPTVSLEEFQAWASDLNIELEPDIPAFRQIIEVIVKRELQKLIQEIQAEELRETQDREERAAKEVAEKEEVIGEERDSENEEERDEDEEEEPDEDEEEEGDEEEEEEESSRTNRKRKASSRSPTKSSHSETSKKRKSSPGPVVPTPVEVRRQSERARSSNKSPTKKDNKKSTRKGGK